MSTKAMGQLRDKIDDGFDMLARKPELGAGDIDLLHKMTSTMKNIDKIMLMSEEGYSNDGDWEAEMRGTYGRGHNRNGRGGQDGYSRAGDGYAMRGRRRDSMGRYSRDGRDEMMEHLDEMMDSASSDREREMIRDLKTKLERG